MAGLAIQVRNVPTLSPPAAQTVAEFCTCDFVCEYVEPAFGKVGGEPHQQDYTSFLTQKVAPTDTIVFKLIKDGLEVATITDNSYGTYYPTFAAKPLYAGFIADWTLIFAAFSGGIYQIQIEETILGTLTVFTSRKFRLNEYDARSANRTVRIETKQTGNILSSPFEFAGLVEGGWPQSIRLAGKFGEKTPTIETDRFLSTSYQELQNRDEVRYEYSLFLDYLPEQIYNEISSIDVLANTFTVTDYDVFAGAIYRSVPVVIDSFSETTFLPDGHVRAKIILSDVTKNNIKRNF